MMKSFFLKTKQFIQLLISHYSQGDVSDSAAVLAFYSLLSIFPILFIAGSILNLFHFHTADIMLYLEPIFPDRIYAILKPVIDSTYQRWHQPIINRADCDDLVCQSGNCGLSAQY